MAKRYKCYECGEVFEEDDIILKEVWESRGEYWGVPCSEKMVYAYCPHCGAEEDCFDELEEEEYPDVE